MPRSTTPQLLPVLSRGRHRSPRAGACFMEYASFLAGEKWSDHPTCTHPALATLARAVNDCSGADSRDALLPLIPAVIGLTGGGLRSSIAVAVLAAGRAMPVVSESRERAIAAGLLRCDEILQSQEHAGTSDPLRLEIAEYLTRGDAATRWARGFLAGSPRVNAHSTAMMAEAIIRTCVVGIAEACIQAPDAMLHDLLVHSIALFSPRVAAPAEATESVISSRSLAQQAH